ncbi:MAG: Spo0B domain-containing protein [Clostridia bacterium]
MLPPQDSPNDAKPRAPVSAPSGMGAGFSSLWLRLAARRAATLLAYERHRANNQVQVVAGWITLGRLEKAQEYLERVVEAERARSDALRILPAWAQLRLVELWSLAERVGATVVIDVGADARPSWSSLLARLDRVIQGARAVPEEVAVRVHVRGVGFRVQVSGGGAAALVRTLPGRWVWHEGTAVLDAGWREGADDVR